jgi:hypothetical protein
MAMDQRISFPDTLSLHCRSSASRCKLQWSTADDAEADLDAKEAATPLRCGLCSSSNRTSSASLRRHAQVSRPSKALVLVVTLLVTAVAASQGRRVGCRHADSGAEQVVLHVRAFLGGGFAKCWGVSLSINLPGTEVPWA